MVGATGVCLNLALFSLLTVLVQVHYMFAALLSVELALCSNYLLNDAWTFGDVSPGRPTWSRLARFQVVATGGILINLTVLRILAERFGVPPLFANMAAISSAAIWNFVLSVTWTWRAQSGRVRSLSAQS